MSSTPSTSTPRWPHRPGRLLVLTLLVLLAHALALDGLPWSLDRLAQGTAATAPTLATASFATRSLEAQPAPRPTTPAQPAPPAAQRAATQRALADAAPANPPTSPAQTAPAPPAQATEPARADDASPIAQSGGDGSGSGSDAVAAAVPASSPASARSLGAEARASASRGAPTAPTAPAAPAATAAKAVTGATAATTAPQASPAAALALGPVELPPAVRLLYEGVGEEKGFMKYTGSGELLWQPEGAQYSARLEISAWGFRVRTWTSRGALEPGGLAPRRFGDKPRGAELATHFQRDKGIISFSANNPDVPLQAGAQDKLSAILQLSALVAGAPGRYGAGSSIRFQAADAHRAEQWSFQVGATEPLTLPGGPLQGLKLSKAPTVEFDQGIEVWLAPSMHYLPVRLRITEANGAFVDLLWRKTQKPEGG